ncbi:hypothetical protein CHARACLAT_023493 [Characodon lateralis]|uniref:Uncharacterized protein n=1 Tax=Characodon lateralis TaxID=208331 RepID=A0ABU7CR38_9TELE|nr:hypothetical protein [Characodon lateralis]
MRGKMRPILLEFPPCSVQRDLADMSFSPSPNQVESLFSFASKLKLKSGTRLAISGTWTQVSPWKQNILGFSVKLTFTPAFLTWVVAVWSKLVPPESEADTLVQLSPASPILQLVL